MKIMLISKIDNKWLLTWRYCYKWPGNQLPSSLSDLKLVTQRHAYLFLDIVLPSVSFLFSFSPFLSFFSYCYQDRSFQDRHYLVDHRGATNDKQLSSCLETLSEHHTILSLIVLGYSPPISFSFSLFFFHLPPYLTRLYWKALLILF